MFMGYNIVTKEDEEVAAMCQVNSTKKFDRALRKLDRPIQQIVRKWIFENLTKSSNPRAEGKNLCGDRKGSWRYRIGDYRLICKIDDATHSILMLDLGHRSAVYA